MDLKLENDEGIIQQANDAEMYKANDVYEVIYEIYLTNKNIICCYEKSNGLFAKSEEIIEKIPLESIKIVHDKLQIFKMDDDEYGLGLQLFLQTGERVHFVFDKKKELQIWYDAIIETITGKKSENNITESKTTKKENAIAGSFLGVVKNVTDMAKDRLSEVKKQIDDEENNIIEKKELENNKLNNNKQQEVEVKESMNNEEKNSIYCRNCGKELVVNSKFCNYCGTPIDNIKNEKKEEIIERKMVYDGKIHKCPNCGEILNSFTSNCPSCGYELRDSINSNAIEELSRKLEEIEAKRDKSKASTKILGAFNLGDGLTKTDEQKISLIRNFPIPNTKEDLYEFLILSKSNIEIDLYENTQIKTARLAVSDAWKAKFEQAYQKAKMLFTNDDKLIEIKNMYEEVNKDINKAKWKIWKVMGACFGVTFGMIIISLIITGIFTSNSNNGNNNHPNSQISTNTTKEIEKDNQDNTPKNNLNTPVSFGDNIVATSNEYIKIKEVEYLITGNYLKCIVSIENINSEKAIEFPSFRVTAYDKEEKILGSEERVLNVLYPNQSTIDEGTSIKISEEPAKLEITMLEPNDYNIKPISNLEHPVYKQLKCQNISVNSNKITGEVYNPNDYTVEQAKITVIFRDSNNKIVSSEISFINNIPANGKVPFDISLYSNTKITDKIEAFADIW